MIMQEHYLDTMKEYIEGMKEEDFVKRGTKKENVLDDRSIMEKLWCVYQKSVEDYGCDHAFALEDAINDVLGTIPTQKKSSVLYCCPFCGSERFIGHQVIHAEIYVDGNGNFDENLPGGLETAIYDSSTPYGPFTCSQCSQEFDELPEKKRVTLSRGTFSVVSGKPVQTFKTAGYGYSHEENGYTVISNGTYAVAVRDQDYNRYYGGQRSFLL